MASKLLKEQISIKQHEHQSVLLVKDIHDEHALDNYVPFSSNLDILNKLCYDVITKKAFAFSWTGQYGTGKSNLALLFAALYSDNTVLRQKAVSLVKSYKDEHENYILKLVNTANYTPICLVGSSQSLEHTVITAIRDNIGVDKIKLFLNTVSANTKDTLNAVLNYLNVSDRRLLIIVDEFGIFLSNCLHNNDDVKFLQYFSELTSKSNGRLVFLGILHKSFDAYNTADAYNNVAQSINDILCKIQNTFQNQFLYSSPFESLRLISSSLTYTGYVPTYNISRFTDIAFKNTQFKDNIQDMLYACLPMHPLTAMMLCAFALTFYSQNSRTICTFMSSSAEYSFKQFLNSNKQLYMLDELFDYISSNIYVLLCAGNDTAEFERCINIVSTLNTSCNILVVQMYKSIAMLNLYGEIWQINANPDLLKVLFADFQHNCTNASILNETYEDTINTLLNKKVIIYRKSTNTLNIFGGSDINLDADINQHYEQTVFDFSTLTSLYQEDHTILATRHYLQTGNLRYMKVQLIEFKSVIQLNDFTKCNNEQIGTIYLIYLDDETSVSYAIHELLTISSQTDNNIFAIAAYAKKIQHKCKMYQALKSLLNAVDAFEHSIIAELNSYIADIENELHELFILSFNASLVIYNGKLVNSYNEYELTEEYYSCEFLSLVSNIADSIFSEAPHLINELINNNKLTSNISGARNKLLTAMCSSDTEVDLGIIKTPPEFSIYWTLFKQYGMHRPDDTCADNKTYKFYLDDKIDGRYYHLFNTTIEYIKQHANTSIDDIYSLWSARPFGIKKGLHPLLMLYFILTTQLYFVIYNNEYPLIDINVSFIDELLVNSDCLTFKYVNAVDVPAAVLNNLYQAVNNVVPNIVHSTKTMMKLDNNELQLIHPTFLIKIFINFINHQKSLTLNTTHLSESSLKLRELIKLSTEPDNILESINSLYPTLSTSYNELSSDLAEINNYYDVTLLKIHDELLNNLNHDQSLPLTVLNERAKCINISSTDIPFRNFVNKLIEYTGDVGSCERIVTGCTNGTIKNISDDDIQKTKDSIKLLSKKFKKLEYNKNEEYNEGKKKYYYVSFKQINVDAFQSTNVDKIARQYFEQMFNGLSYEEATAVILKLSTLLNQYYAQHS